MLVYTNVGVSMMPLLRQGKDLMVIENVQDGRPLHRLDSVLFKRRNGQYVLHRIMDNPEGNKESGAGSNGNTIYRICGDNTYQLEPVRRDMIIGRLVAVERGAKTGENQTWHIDVNSRSYHIYSWIMWGLWPYRRAWFPIKWRIKWVIKLPIRVVKLAKKGELREKVSKKLAYIKKKL